MKLLKGIVIAVVIILILLAGAVYWGVSNLDRLVADAIESVGSQTTGTEVTVGSVNISLGDGRGELKGLEIGNPPQFTSDYAIHIGRTALQIDLKTLAAPVIVISDVTIDGARLNAEQAKGVDNNLQVIVRQVEHSAGGSSTNRQAPPESSASTEEQSSKLKFRIQRFKFTNADVSLMSAALGERRNFTLPEIVLNDVGGAQGATADELASLLVAQVINKVSNGVRKIVEDRVGDEAEKKLKETLDKKLSDKDKESLNRLRDLLNR